MSAHYEPVDEHLRRSVRIERVVSEVIGLRGELQRIGSRLAALRAELVTLGADPALVAQRVATGTRAETPRPGAAPDAEAASSAHVRGSVETTGGDLVVSRTVAVDLVSVDEVWVPKRTTDVTRDDRPS